MNDLLTVNLRNYLYGSNRPLGILRAPDRSHGRRIYVAVLLGAGSAIWASSALEWIGAWEWVARASGGWLYTLIWR